MSSNNTAEMERAEEVLRRFHFPKEVATVKEGPRRKGAIDEIIAAVQQANAEADADADL